MKLLLFALAVFLIVTAGQAQENDPFRSLHALEGTWGMQSRKGMSYETWKASGEHSISGLSYRLNGTDTLNQEQLKLVKKGNDIFYISIVTGQNNQEPISFKLLETKNSTFTFDNPSHDFPQRIIYKFSGNDSLHARIEGMDKGSYRKFDFYFKRIK